MEVKVLGISRSPRFSPNSTARDEAIFQGVVDALRRSGCHVERVCEDHFVSAEGFDRIFSMAREPRVLHELALVEEQGVRVVNSAKALLKATRLSLTETFEQAGVPVPASPVLFRKEEGKMTMQWRGETHGLLPFPFWLKRSEACAQSAEDVCFVEDEARLNAALEGYCERGIDEVLASEHLVGDLVKFYGVEGTDFFYYYYPTSDQSFSKFGLEKINGAPSGFPLEAEALKQCADRAADLCGIVVYGGDCIVDAAGHFRIIDFNDCPSYSRCCAEAAKAIAEKVRIL